MAADGKGVLGPALSLRDSLIAREAELLRGGKKGDAENRLLLADTALDLAAAHVAVYNTTRFFQGRGNEESLNGARKTVSRSLLYLEELVTNWVDAGPLDLEEKQAALSGIGAERRYRTVRKAGLALSLLEYAWGDDSKWKWSFVDLGGRLAAVSKNILDMRNLVSSMDPRSPEYEPVMFHVRMTKKLLFQAANRYRQKYELSTHVRDDFMQAINFLNALRRLHIILSEKAEVEELKKTVDAWTVKLLRDSKPRGEPGGKG